MLLLEEGASLVRGPEEILTEFELLYPHKIAVTVLMKHSRTEL